MRLINQIRHLRLPILPIIWALYFKLEDLEADLPLSDDHREGFKIEARSKYESRLLDLEVDLSKLLLSKRIYYADLVDVENDHAVSGDLPIVDKLQALAPVDPLAPAPLDVSHIELKFLQGVLVIRCIHFEGAALCEQIRL